MATTFIAGPCVIESMEVTGAVAQELVRINQELGTDISIQTDHLTRLTALLSTLSVGPGIEKACRCSAISRRSTAYV